jgi:glycosyltransferase involved in cell wall biosynthesis
MAEVIRKKGNIKAMIVGSGPLEDQLKNRAADLGILDDLIFTGFRKDIPDLLGVFDIFVTSSLSEGLGAAVLEAMCAGKPVVGTQVGAIPETVINGKTGLLVPPRNSRALADAIVRLIECPEKRRSMGERGRQRVIDKFSIERMVKNYEQFYDALAV